MLEFDGTGLSESRRAASALALLDDWPLSIPESEMSSELRFLLASIRRIARGFGRAADHRRSKPTCLRVLWAECLEDEIASRIGPQLAEMIYRELLEPTDTRQLLDYAEPGPPTTTVVLTGATTPRAPALGWASVAA